ncbi:MAG: late competence development ComFB family protein [Lachnospiraceae bacterium]
MGDFEDRTPLVEGFYIKNIMETIVKEELENNVSNFDCCTCKQCQADIITLALNHLQPYYVTTKQGEVLSRANMLKYTSPIEVAVAVAKAVEIVRNNPRHIK